MGKSKTKKNISEEVESGTNGSFPTFVTYKPYLFILILLFGILSYSNTFYGPFIFDDRVNIVDNEGILLESFSSTDLAMVGQTLLKKTRPVALASFALNYYIGGLNTFTYHLVNLLIHLFSASFVYLFLNLTLNLPSLQERYGKQSQEIALLSSLLFVAHPIQTQAVSYIVQRMASLGAMFYLLSCWAYAKGRIVGDRKKKFFYIASVISALLAFGTKENTLTLPIFIFLYECFFFSKMDFEKLKKKIGPFFILFILLLIIWSLYTKKIDLIQVYYKRFGFTMPQRVLTEFRVVIFYLSLLIFPLPSRLNLDHQFSLSYSLIDPPTTLLCFALLMALIIYSIQVAKKRPLISFAIIWFWGNLVLESSIIPLDLIFEHRLYLPSMGFFLLTSIFLINALKGLKKQGPMNLAIRVGLLLALIAPLSALTYQRNKVWQDKLLLWKDVVKKSPNKARPHNNLGFAYDKKGLLKEAITQFRLALEINPHYDDACSNLGNAYQVQGQLAEAIVLYQRTLKINADYKGAHNNLGTIYLLQGKQEQAIAEFTEELKLKPDNALVYYNLGNAYRDQGLLDKAISQYKHALKIDPNHKKALIGLGIVYHKQGKIEQAVGELVKEIKRHPDNLKAYNNLGNIYAEQGRLSEAIDSYRQALKIDPDHVEAHNSLGSAYSRKEMYVEAEKELLKAIELDSKHPGAYYNLGTVYFKQGLYEKAIKAFQQDLKLDSKDDKDAKSHFMLGQAYAKKGLYEKAVIEYKETLTITPQNTDTYISLGLIYVKNKKYQEAKEVLEKAVAIDSNFTAAHKNLGNVYYLLGIKDKAINEWEKALALNPGDMALAKNLEVVQQKKN